MKNTLQIAIATLLLGFTTSEMSAQWSNSKVVGNGNITTRSIQTSDYAHVKVVGSMDVHLERGAEGNISVTTDDNVHEYLEIMVEGGDLVIKTKKNVSIRTKKGIHVTVPFQDLSEVSLVGSGDIDSKDTIKANELELSVTGSGDIILAVETSNLNAKVTGSGDLELSGRTTNLEVKVSGSGDFDGDRLTSENTEAYVSGSGDARVHASNNLKARVNGSGDISYKGNPAKVDKKVVGSGDISN